MVRVCQRTQIPARSEKLVVGQMDCAAGWRYNVLVDPQNVFINDDGLAVARTVSTVKEGCCAVQVVNVTDVELTIEARVPLGIGYPVKSDSQTECAAIFTYELQDLTMPEVVADISVSPCAVDNLLDVDLSKSELTSEQEADVHGLQLEFSDVFSKTRRDYGRTSLLTHSINTEGAAPIKKTPYRVPQSYMAAAEQHVKEMAEDDLIEPSFSPWRAPIVMARKKDGSLRFCTDFRGLNSVTVTDAHPLPRIDSAIDQLTGSVFFSSLDLSAGYWQVEIDPQDREKTAFSVGKGLWQHKLMAMGLKNAPPTFQRLMELALNGVDWQHVLVYIDGICLFSTTFEQHLALLLDVLIKLRAAKLKLKPSKCQLFQRSVVFLGHEVSANGVRPNPTNIEKVATWRTPKNVSEVRSFLSLASYYRKFCKDFPTVAEPLQRLTESKTTFQWSEECDAAFNQLRQQLTSPPLLVYPQFDKDFRLDCDASKFVIGTVLSQGEWDKECVVAYASKSLSSSQRNWVTYDREWWAIVWSVRHFRPYLAGRHFTVVTDHQLLVGSTNIDPASDPTNRRARLAIELSTYDFDIVHRDGSKHTNADALSRSPAETVNNIHIDVIEDLKVQQQNDPNISQLRGWIEQGQKAPASTIKEKGFELRKLFDQYDRYSIKDGVVYRRWKPTNKDEWQLQIILPKAMRENVICSLHDKSCLLCHVKTLNRVKDRYFWPGMFTDVKEWCEKCVKCQKKRDAVPKLRAPLQPITTSRPRELVTIDLVEYPVSNDGNRYALVVIDNFTKYLELFPIKDGTAVTIADKLAN